MVEQDSRAKSRPTGHPALSDEQGQWAIEMYAAGHTHRQVLAALAEVGVPWSLTALKSMLRGDSYKHLDRSSLRQDPGPTETKDAPAVDQDRLRDDPEYREWAQRTGLLS